MKWVVALKTTAVIMAMMSASACTSMGLGQPEFKKPLSDTNDYQSFTLDNGLRVLLVSNVEFENASAALSVNVGSGHDPDDRLGLAHFLEHMLFLGTEKYPEAGEYQAYIKANGGSHNAYTSLELTNYYFSTVPSAFEGGLDRFAQFFIAPTFDSQFVERERSIVDSEYRARKGDESRRLWAATNAVMHKNHVSSRFSVGSVDTLADRTNAKVREDLLSFYKRYYQAQNMALVVAGPMPLEQLKQWAEAKFQTVPGSKTKALSVQGARIDADTLPVFLQLKPLKEMRRLSFTFALPSIKADKGSRPLGFISHILGDESEGSLLQVLRSKGWVESLSASTGYSDDAQSSLKLNLSLTPEGEGKVSEIGSAVFAMIHLLEQQGIEKSAYDEQRQLGLNAYNYSDAAPVARLTVHLSGLLQEYTAENVLSEPYILTKWAPEKIKALLERLTPSNVLVTFVSPASETNETTGWYEVDYQLSQLHSDWLLAWRQARGGGLSNSQLRLPSNNAYIATELKQGAVEDALQPIKQTVAPGFVSWQQPLTRFKRPTNAFYVSLRSSAAVSTPAHSVYAELLVSAVQEQTNGEAYPAVVAGLGSNLYRHSRGFSLRLEGFNEKQPLLLNSILPVLLEPKLNQKRFDQYRADFKRILNNKRLGRPSDVVAGDLYNALIKGRWSPKQQLSALESVTFAGFEQYAQSWMKSLEVVSYIVGDFTVEQAALLNNGVLNAVSPYLDADLRTQKVGLSALTSNSALVSDAAQSDTALALYYQNSADDTSQQGIMKLLGTMIQAPFYQRLRTEKEAGYIVQAYPLNLFESSGLVFSVQSNRYSVAQLEQLISEFLTDYKTMLAELTDDEIATFKNSLVEELMQKPESLSQLAQTAWYEIDRERGFGFDQSLAEFITKLTKEDLIDGFDQLINQNPITLKVAAEGKPN